MQLTTLVSALLSAASLVSAQTVHVVSVGSTDSAKALTFSPKKVTAAKGDMIQFQFRNGNHTVTQSTFDQPCMPVSLFTNNTGIYSGYQPVSASQAMGTIPTYTIMVNNTNPMWFYCSQGKHCQSGMVMVVNENTAANSTRSIENFASLAAAATANLPGDATSIPTGQTGTTTGGNTATTSQATAGAGMVTVSSMLGALGFAVALFV